MLDSHLPTLEELEVKLGGINGKRIIVRADLNVPLSDGKIDDDLRIRESGATLNWLCDRGASVVVCSHLGRPKLRELDLSLNNKVHKYLEMKLEREINFKHKSKLLINGEIKPLSYVKGILKKPRSTVKWDIKLF